MEDQKSMECEKCQSDHDGSFATGRFCSVKCSRSFAANVNREETSRKVSETLKRKYQSGELVVKNQFQTGHDAKRDNIVPRVGYKHSDETKQKILKKSTERNERNFQYKIQNIPFESLPKNMRRKVLFLERGNKCECCQLESWLGLPLSIQVDHIDGNHTNNQKENLRLLCPNCHSLTPTWKGRNITSQIKKEDFVAALKSTPNIHQALKFLGLSPVGGNYKTARKHQAEINQQQNTSL